MSATTAWAQLSGLARTSDLREGLEARIADPLWMLARQWQFGAFKGEDAASPVRVQVRHGSVPVDRIAGADGTVRPLTDQSAPLEAAIEAEAIATGPSAPRRSAEAALAFLRRVPDRVRAPLAASVRKVCPLAADATASRLLRLCAARVFDAAAFRRLPPAHVEKLAVAAGATAAERVLIAAAFKAWTADYDRRFVEPQRTGGYWDETRLEYACSLHASTIGAELRADGYAGGRFDWHEVNLSSANGRAFAARPAQIEDAWIVPARVRYAGMPARRFWDFENGVVFFGELEAEATDLPQLVLTEFATVYSDDWYVVPVPMPTGSLGRVVEVRVFDCFGESRVVTSAAVQDGANRAWRFFELTGDRSVESNLSPWLYVPRVADGLHQGPPIERTELMRDEAANLAWAIEEQVEQPDGSVRDRRQQWLALRETAGAGVADGAWRYVLEEQTPPFWLPLLPEVERQRVTGYLRRGRMRSWDELGTLATALAGPQGRMMAPAAPLRIHDETVPRGGVELTRAFQAARGADGRLVVWVGRRKRPAGVMRTSGRDTDVALAANGRPVDGGGR